MGKIAFVFSGQGAQYSGMGLDLYKGSPAARALFELADRLRPGTSKQCFEASKEDLLDTEVTQPCLYCVDLAAALALSDNGVEAELAAGFSLGEIPALAYSGALSYEEGFALAVSRGKLMKKAAKKQDSAMAAVLKLDNAAVEKLCAKHAHIYPVNYNCPGQLVVSGLKEELDLFKNDVREAGGKMIPLAVSGGFHSPFMEEASKALGDVLKTMRLSKPEIPLYSNFTAKPYGENISELLTEQVKNPVRWQETILNMLSAGADTFIEVGPGKTLVGLISKISAQAKTYHAEDMESLQKTVFEVRKNA